MDKRITKALKEVSKAQQRLARAVASLQRRCRHSHIAECEYEGGAWHTHEPERICLDCGMTEIGWGPGYQVLKPMKWSQIATVAKIERNDLYKLRQGIRITDDHKGPLIRKESTVADFVDQWAEEHGIRKPNDNIDTASSRPAGA